MNFSISIILFCLSVFSVVSARIALDATSQNVIVTENIGDFLKAHPNLTVEPMQRINNRGRSLSSVRYTLGARISGDKLVAQSSDAYEYPAPKDVSIQLTYPEDDGKGKIVTYVEIVCDQDSTEGNAYVVKGSIGQRFVSIIVEAKQTVRFSFWAQFYGSG